MTGSVHSVVDAVVVHRRLRPRANDFRYRVAYLQLGLGELARAANRWLKVDRPGLVAVHRADHGARDGGDLEAGCAGFCPSTGWQRRATDPPNS